MDSSTLTDDLTTILMAADDVYDEEKIICMLLFCYFLVVLGTTGFGCNLRWVKFLLSKCGFCDETEDNNR